MPFCQGAASSAASPRGALDGCSLRRSPPLTHISALLPVVCLGRAEQRWPQNPPAGQPASQGDSLASRDKAAERAEEEAEIKETETRGRESPDGSRHGEGMCGAALLCAAREGWSSPAGTSGVNHRGGEGGGEAERSKRGAPPQGLAAPTRLSVPRRWCPRRGCPELRRPGTAAPPGSGTC